MTGSCSYGHDGLFMRQPRIRQIKVSAKTYSSILCKWRQRCAVLCLLCSISLFALLTVCFIASLRFRNLKGCLYFSISLNSLIHIILDWGLSYHLLSSFIPAKDLFYMLLCCLSASPLHWHVLVQEIWRRPGYRKSCENTRSMLISSLRNDPLGQGTPVQMLSEAKYAQATTSQA